MKTVIYLGIAISCLSCANKNGNVTEKATSNYQLNYTIKYKDLREKLTPKNSLDPFVGTTDVYPSILLREAGLKDFEEVTYIPPLGILLVRAPSAFHDEVERLLKVKGEKP